MSVLRSGFKSPFISALYLTGLVATFLSSFRHLGQVDPADSSSFGLSTSARSQIVIRRSALSTPLAVNPAPGKAAISSAVKPSRIEPEIRAVALAHNLGRELKPLIQLGQKRRSMHRLGRMGGAGRRALKFQVFKPGDDDFAASFC